MKTFFLNGLSIQVSMYTVWNLRYKEYTHENKSAFSKALLSFSCLFGALQDGG